MNEYKRTQTTISMINYHFVFCPRYRRKIFDDIKVEKRFKELVYGISKDINCEIIAIECHRDHTHIFLSSVPKLSPSDIMAKIKGVSSRIIRSEFPYLSTTSALWTRSFFVSTAGNVSSSIIKRYVETQKTRG
jgi:putative transposase